MKPHSKWTNAELAEALPLIETVSPIDREICREAAKRLRPYAVTVTDRSSNLAVVSESRTTEADAEARAAELAAVHEPSTHIVSFEADNADPLGPQRRTRIMVRQSLNGSGLEGISPLSAAVAPAPASPVRVPHWLLAYTFEVQHSPNCAKAFLVRLAAPGSGALDRRPSTGSRKNSSRMTRWASATAFEEAADAARTELIRRAQGMRKDS